MTTVPCFVRELADADASAAALVENLQRQDLNPIEEAEGFRRLIEEFGLTHEELGTAIGKSRSHVANLLRLLNLPPEVVAHVRAGTLTAGHARAALAFSDPAAARGANDRQRPERSASGGIVRSETLGRPTKTEASSRVGRGHSRPPRC